MNTKNWIRVAVYAGVLAWPAVETVRYCQARQQLAASEEVKQAVIARLDDARARQVQVANTRPKPASEAPAKP